MGEMRVLKLPWLYGYTCPAGPTFLKWFFSLLFAHIAHAEELNTLKAHYFQTDIFLETGKMRVGVG